MQCAQYRGRGFTAPSASCGGCVQARSREVAGVRDKDVLKEKYYINKTVKAPSPMRFSSPVTSDFPLVFVPSTQHQPGLTDRSSPGSRFSQGLALTKQRGPSELPGCPVPVPPLGCVPCAHPARCFPVPLVALASGNAGWVGLGWGLGGPFERVGQTSCPAEEPGAFQ